MSKDATKTKLIDIGLGLLIWLIGYIASIVLWGAVSPDMLGWVLFVVFLPLMIYIPYSRFRNRKETVGYYLLMASVWVLIAVVLDYLFIVQMFNSQSYYKLDVYVYYAITFIAPFLIGTKYGVKS
jgi:hypothetical protein